MVVVTICPLVADGDRVKEDGFVDVGKNVSVLEKNERYALLRIGTSVLWKRTWTENASTPPVFPMVKLPSWLVDDHCCTTVEVGKASAPPSPQGSVDHHDHICSSELGLQLIPLMKMTESKYGSLLLGIVLHT